MKREAKVTPEITAYIKLKRIYGNIEVKQTTTNRFNLSNFEEQQVASLLASELSGLVWKHSDADPRLKPCDISSMPPIPSYIVIKYPKSIFFIWTYHIHQYIINGVKSLTSEEARELSTFELVK